VLLSCRQFSAVRKCALLFSGTPRLCDPVLTPGSLQAAEDWQQRVAEAKQRLEGCGTTPATHWQAEYVRSYLLLKQRRGELDDDGEVAAPLSMLLPASVVASVKVTKKAVAAALSSVTHLAEAHLGGKVVGLEHPQVKHGLEQWLSDTMTSAQEQLLTLLSHAAYAELLLAKLASRPREKLKVISHKAKVLEQAAAKHRQLLGWGRWALQPADRWQQLPEPTRWVMAPPLRCKLEQLVASTLDDLRAGGTTSSGSGGAVPDAAQRVYLLQCTMTRLQEERTLLQEECEGLLAIFDGRVQVGVA
jgi:hypothetical protein